MHQEACSEHSLDTELFIPVLCVFKRRALKTEGVPDADLVLAWGFLFLL